MSDTHDHDHDLDDDEGWAPKPAEAAYATADALLDHAAGAERPTLDVYLPGADLWVRIKALIRDEAIKVSDTKSSVDRERKIITWSLAEPAMTYQQVEQWHRTAIAGDVQVLVEAVTELSGLDDQARKRASRRFREQPSS